MLSTVHVYSDFHIFHAFHSSCEFRFSYIPGRLREEEAKCSEADKQIRSLEHEVEDVENNIELFESMEMRASEEEEAFSQRFDEMTTKCVRSERKSAEYQQQIRELEGKRKQLLERIANEKRSLQYEQTNFELLAEIESL